VASSAYMTGRKIWARPQAMLWSNNPGIAQNGLYVPQGDEFEDFVILSDHNRGELSISKQRIESRQRMINGTMRSYFNADKITISTLWDNFPSRSYKKELIFSPNGSPEYINLNENEEPPIPVKYKDLYTVDGGAGGVDVLDWHENHPGPFWVFLAYDKFNNFQGYPDQDSHNKLGIYNEVKLMFFGSFDYTVVKRGGSNHDLWNISVTLEEA
jgi:hypothetical protein